MAASLDDLAVRLRHFKEARDWGQFHSPKNLAAALSVEAGELLEHFQWLTEEQSRALPVQKLDEVRLEMADVLLYLIQLADETGIDLASAADAKIAINEAKYPVDKSYGSAKKASEL